MSSIEPRWLTPEECLHYAELGLCGPIDATALKKIRTADEELIDGFDSKNEELNEQLIDLQDELEKVKAEFAAAVVENARLTHLIELRDGKAPSA